MKNTVRATARTVKKHRVFFLFVMGLFAVGLIAGSYAVQENATFSGQTQAGDHDWWTGFKYVTEGNPPKATPANQAFCTNCHTGIGNDLDPALGGGEHKDTARSGCSFCHTPATTDHAANSSQCTDCHTSEATELESPTEAHNGIMAKLGEDNGVAIDAKGASQTCQSCHTHAEVEMTVTADPPIPLQMGGA